MSGGTGGPAGTYLVVRADDFGMCHAVNEGVRAAWEQGIVTTTTTMAPCPWYDEAAAIIRDTGLPTGVHQTLTCEWDFFRWRPLTDGASLTGPDATFWRTSPEAEEHDDHQEVVAELMAQVGRLRDAGIQPEFLDAHMRTNIPAAFDEVSQLSGVPYLYSASVPLDSMEELTPRDAKDKKAWLLEWLGHLQPGLHMLVCHPAVPSAELGALTSPSSEPYPWAALWRVVDLDVLTDPEVHRAVERSGITLSSFAAAMASPARRRPGGAG